MVLVIIDKIKRKLKKLFYLYLQISLFLAILYQKYSLLYRRLVSILPDISDQYNDKVNWNTYLEMNVRSMHCFQIKLILDELNEVQDFPVKITDIGDSSGNHSIYLKHMFLDRINISSTNIDQRAIKKLRSKGLSIGLSYNADYLLLFEVLEHLENPIQFLRDLLNESNKETKIILTVPYRKRSRTGKIKKNSNVENKHIFELSPDDWKFVFKQAGLSVHKEKIYLQYLNIPIFKHCFKWIWRWWDYEGFYGVVLYKED